MTGNSQVKLVTSIGEPVAGRVSSGPASLKQGFLFPVYSGPVSPYLNKDVFVFPNPASDLIYIKDEKLQVASCAIFNLLGQRVISLPVSGDQVSLTALRSGFYILTLMDSRKRRIATFSIIKK